MLTGYLVLASYVISPSTIKIPDTDWAEPVLLWLTVTMPIGSGKSTLFRYLFNQLQQIRSLARVSREDTTWILNDASFEKMCALMHSNASRLLGLYDELSAFLSQINLYRGRSLLDSHDLALSLQLYNGHP